jgi:hypothetical protein
MLVLAASVAIWLSFSPAVANETSPPADKQPPAASPAPPGAAGDAPRAAGMIRPPRHLLATSDVLLPTSRQGLQGGHAWVILPVSDTDADIIHFPPRDGTSRTSAGSARLVLSIKTSQAAAVASWDGRLFLVGGSPVADRRPVGAITATSRIGPGSWRYAPNGRIETLPPLDGPGQIESLIGTAHGLAVITRPTQTSTTAAAPPSPAATLQILDRLSQSWITLPLPERLVGKATAELHLLTDATDLLLATRHPGDSKLELYRAAVTRTVREQPVPGQERPQRTISLAASWAFDSSVTLSPDLAALPISTGERHTTLTLLRTDGRVVAVHKDVGRVGASRLNTIRPWRVEPPTQLLNLPVETPFVDVLGLDSRERLALMTYTKPEPLGPRQRGERRADPLSSRPPPDLARLEVREVDLASGAVMATSTAHGDSPIGRREWQSLWLVTLLIGATVLLVVVRTDGPGIIVLPANSSLATPGRRLIGFSVDLVAAAGVVGIIVGKTPFGVLAAAAGAELNTAGSGIGSSPLTLILGVLAAGMAIACISEAIFGRTLGKWSVGTRCSAMARDGEKWVAATPSLTQIIIRNLIKWSMPPVGLMMFFDASSRHPGDILSRTTVVRDEPPPETDDRP